MASGPPINLHYLQRADPFAPDRRPAHLVSRLITAYLCYGLVMCVLVLAVPKFERMLRDFDAQLPAATMVLIKASRFCVGQYLWLKLLPTPAIWAAVNVSITNRKRRRRIRLAAFMLVAAFLIYSVGALGLPLLRLADNVETHPQKVEK